MGKHRVDCGRNGSEQFFNRRSPSGAQGRKAQQKKNWGWCQWRQTQGASWGTWRNWPPPHPTRQKYRFLYDHMGTTVTGTVPAATKFSVFVCAHYNLPPITLKKMCWLLSILLRNSRTYLQSRRTRHLMPQWIVTSSSSSLDKPPPSNWLYGKPLIHQGRSISEEEVCQGGHGLETRGA